MSFERCPETDLKPPRPDEDLARTLVEPLIGASLIHVDPPGPDFLICRDGQPVGGLEVTTALPTRYGRLRGQMDKYGAEIENRLLETCWDARLDEDLADLSRWDYARVGMLVKAIEQHGVTSSRYLRDPLLRAELKKFGIVNVERLDYRRDGNQCVFLLPQGWSGAVGWKAVDVLIQERVNSKRRQLARLDGEKHLFVWVPHGAWAAAAAMGEEPSSDPPMLPGGVDTVWLAQLFGTIDKVFRRRRRGDGWDVLAPGGL